MNKSKKGSLSILMIIGGIFVVIISILLWWLISGASLEPLEKSQIGIFIGLLFFALLAIIIGILKPTE